MTDQQIKEERWTLTRLSAAINTKENCLAWLANCRLIRNTYETVSFVISQQHWSPMPTQGIDGFRWSCRGCDFRKSVRDDSFFSGSRIALEQLLQLIYCWCYDMPQFNIIHETNISCKTIIDWCNFCRDECENYIERH
nr:hypothetical protein BgiMline_020779 [Biomphalaria glabrata]